MVKASGGSAQVSTYAVMNSLKIHRIAFGGPFYTQGKRLVFFVERNIFLESELVDLFAQNKLNRDGIQELAKCIEATKSGQSQWS